MITFNFNPYFACKVGILCQTNRFYFFSVLGADSARCSMIECVARAAFVYCAVKLEICLAFPFFAIYSVFMGVMMNMAKYRRLKHNDRLVIEAYYGAGYTQTDIAAMIGVDRSTICRELRKGMYEHLNSNYTTRSTYSSDKAQEYTDYQNTSKGKELKIADDHALASFLEEKIAKDKYSPDAALALIRTDPDLSARFKVSISTTTLYRYIDKGLFLNLTNKDLPHVKKRYKRVRPVQKRRSAGTSIEQRPDDILSREYFGDWEMDTVKGVRRKSKGCMLVLTERKTRDEFTAKLPDQKAASVVAVLDELEDILGEDFSKVFHTITVDNGVEFSDFEGMQRSKKHSGNRTSIYYCHAYCSSERGSNENGNRLIRRHAPKGTDLDQLTHEDVKSIQRWMNNYPRKLLGYRTSGELFREEMAAIGVPVDAFL